MYYKKIVKLAYLNALLQIIIASVVGGWLVGIVVDCCLWHPKFGKIVANKFLL